MRFITVTPAGRRRYLEALVPYLLQNRDRIDEHHWWVNTRNPEDLAYLHELADEYPDFFKLVIKPMQKEAKIGVQIWAYMSQCVEPDTVYLCLDDDICYIHPDAIQRMFDYRLANPEPFLVLGSIVNNAICSYYYQQSGRIPKDWGELHPECMDELGWRSGPFALKLHQAFLQDLMAGQAERWVGLDTSGFDGIRRFSVNAICWRGEDMAQVEPLELPNFEEESLLTADIPQLLNRPNKVCPDALFGHYAFYVQRRYLERIAPEILEQYRRIANGVEGRLVPFPISVKDQLTFGRKIVAGRIFGVLRSVVHQGKWTLKRLAGQKVATAASKPEQEPTSPVEKPSKAA